MDVTVTDVSNIRTISRILQCLSKLSDHIQFHPRAPQSLHLRTLTPSQSAYAVFRLNQPSFSTIQISSSTSTFKIPTRILLPILRAPQQILSLRFRASSRPTRLYIHIRSKSQVKKTFRLPLSDGHLPSIRFDTTTCPNTFQTTPRFFLDSLSHFHSRLEEITIVPSLHSLILQSFVDDVANPANVILRTELTIDTKELESHVCQNHSPVPLTICCRYFRAILEFCDPIPAPLRFWYNQPGKPILIDFIPLPSHIGDQIPFDANFVFASRLTDDTPQDQQQPQTQPSIIPRPQPNTLAQRPRTIQRPPERFVAPPTETLITESDPRQSQRQQQIPPLNRTLFESEIQPTQPQNMSSQQTPIANRDSDPYESTVFDTPAARNIDSNLQQTRRPLTDVHNRRDNQSLRSDEDDDDDDDFVEGTPPPE